MALSRRFATFLVIVAMLTPGFSVFASEVNLTATPIAATPTVNPIATPSIVSPESNPIPTLTVRSGDSIQATIDSAQPGDVIAIEPGIYREGLSIKTSQLTIVASDDPGAVVLENPGEVVNGIEVFAGGDGFVLKRITVRGFEENGVYLEGIDGFFLQDVTAEDNGEYGFFPVLTANGVIDRCTASGHADAGIYIGQSRQIAIQRSTAFGNLSGILVENVDSVTISDNESYDNVDGISVILLPGLAWTTSSNVVVEGNRVHGNNHPQFAAAEGFAAGIPPGIGIMVIGTNNVVVRNNVVSGNNFFGIAVATALLAAVLSGQPVSVFDGMDPTSNNVRVEGNKLSGNGLEPSVPGLPFGDLVWDGTGVGSCWINNDFATSVPESLPSC